VLHRAVKSGYADLERLKTNTDLEPLRQRNDFKKLIDPNLKPVKEGEYTLYAVTRDGTVAMPRNWPRLWHEGNFAGSWSALMNLVTSFAMIGLLVTGPWIWLRRQLTKRARRMDQAAPA